MAVRPFTERQRGRALLTPIQVNTTPLTQDSKIPRFQGSRLRRPVTQKWTHSKIPRFQDSRLRWSVTQTWTHSSLQDSKIPRFAAQQCDRRRSRDRRAVNRSRFQIPDSQVCLLQPKSDSRLADSKIPRPRCATLRSVVPANSSLTNKQWLTDDNAFSAFHGAAAQQMATLRHHLTSLALVRSSAARGRACSRCALNSQRASSHLH